jgi:hypothetical protein
MEFGPQRPRVVAAVRIAALAIALPTFALSGCGSAPATLASARPAAARPPDAAATRAAAVLAPPRVKSEARQFGLRLFSRIVMPRGARQLDRNPVPSVLGAGHPGVAAPAPGQPSVTLSRFYVVPMPAAAALAYLRGHLPRGTESGGHGSYAPGGITRSLEAWAQAVVVPASVDTARVWYTIAIEPGGRAFARIDVQVELFAPRPAADVFAASDYRSVTLTYRHVKKLGGDTDGMPEGRTVSMTTVSRPVLSTIVGLVDGLQTDSHECMENELAGLWLRLNPARAGQPAVSITLEDCGHEYLVHVGNAPNPLLWTSRSNALPALMARLLQVHPSD